MSFLLDLIFPRRCYSCGKAGRYLCLDCQSHLVVRSIKPSLNSSFSRLSLFRYHGAIKQMIHDLKFEFVADLVPELTLLTSRTLKSKFPQLLQYWQAEKFTLVPIPLHPHRHHWRGFNQAELLAQALAPLINLNYQSLLVRTADTRPQTSIKDKKLRHTNISHAFAMKNACLPARQDKFILFDDVYTTGSTIRSAISCLPQTSQIWVLTLA